MTDNNNCKGCIYHKKIDCLSGKKVMACYYCIDTGNLRNCKPENCDKKDTNLEHRVVDKTRLGEWCLKNRNKALNGY